VEGLAEAIKAGAGSPYLQEVLLRRGWKRVPGQYQHAITPRPTKARCFSAMHRPKRFTRSDWTARSASLWPMQDMPPTGLWPRRKALCDRGEQLWPMTRRASRPCWPRHPGRRLAVGRNGNVYLTPHRPQVPQTAWQVKTGTVRAAVSSYCHCRGQKSLVDADLQQAAAVAFTPDQRFLCVTDAARHEVWSYLIQPDGSLTYKQRYYFLHVDTVDQSGADGLCPDSDGRLRGHADGVQVCMLAVRRSASSPRPTARFPACVSAARSSIRSTPLVATASSSARCELAARGPEDGRAVVPSIPRWSASLARKRASW